MPTITFYGGVGEVGGNKILVCDGDTKLMLDFGVSFTSRKRFYADPYLTPRSIDSLIELGVLPRIQGLYRVGEAESPIDAVVLSHPHLDHSGYISLLNRSIPVYCGEATLRVLSAFGETSPRRLELDFTGIEFKTFRTGDRLKIGSVEVEPWHVDHSTPGSYGLIVHTSAGSIVYTGDFRAHGTKPQLTQDFTEAAARADPTAVITEATNTAGAEVSSEEKVKESLMEVVSRAEGLVLASFSIADIDRLRSFIEAARECGRAVAVSMRQAYLLAKLEQDPKLGVPELLKDIVVYRRVKKVYRSWEQAVLKRFESVSAEEASARQRDLIVAASLYDFEDMVKMKPKPGSCYILSSSEPIDEESEVSFTKLLNWLDHFGLPLYHIHASGHILPHQLREKIAEIKPRDIYPIHTPQPKLAEKYLSNLGSRVVSVAAEVSYEVT
ncbi:MAG: hypothetical protein DRN96_02030 [Thermoproteota archaeon]|nr:MAG: hypothetical protein DRN96_02030 [Candidatus Korarchaeota archaeon]